jgi:hypothetical protein
MLRRVLCYGSSLAPFPSVLPLSCPPPLRLPRPPVLARTHERIFSTTVASKVGPNGWGEKADADGSVDHYSNALGEVPEWVFTGSADHDWKDYDGVYGQDWYENTYPSGESGI